MANAPAGSATVCVVLLPSHCMGGVVSLSEQARGPRSNKVVVVCLDHNFDFHNVTHYWDPNLLLNDPQKRGPHIFGGGWPTILAPVHRRTLVPCLHFIIHCHPWPILHPRSCANAWWLLGQFYDIPRGLRKGGGGEWRRGGAGRSDMSANPPNPIPRLSPQGCGACAFYNPTTGRRGCPATWAGSIA